MEKDKISENVEFDVIYADGTRRRVKEGILYEVEDDSMIFHNGTSRGAVLFATAEAALALIDNIGLTKLFGRYIRSDPEDETTLRIIHRLADAPEDIPPMVKQSLFRLGQMDLQASVAAMLRDRAGRAHDDMRLELLAAADQVERMEVLHG